MGASDVEGGAGRGKGLRREGIFLASDALVAKLGSAECDLWRGLGKLDFMECLHDNRNPI